MGYDFKRLPPAPEQQAAPEQPRPAYKRPETLADLDQYYTKGDVNGDEVQKELAMREQTRQRLLASAVNHNEAGDKRDLDAMMDNSIGPGAGAPHVSAQTIQGAKLDEGALNALRAKQQATNAMLGTRRAETLTGLAMSRGQEGAINQALANKAAPGAAAALGQNMGAVGQQVAAQRLQEQQQNTNAYSGALGGLRGQQSQQAQTGARLRDDAQSFNMQQQNQASLGNLQADLQNQQMTDEQRQFALASRFAIDQNQVNANVAAHQAYQNANLQRDMIFASDEQEELKRGAAILNAAASTAGAAIGAGVGVNSDKRLKKNVHRKPRYTRKFLDSLKERG